MVRRHDHNWFGYWVDVYTYVKTKYGQNSSEKFISHFWDRYGHLDRVYIHYKLAIFLFDEFYACRRIGTRFYAALGIGGSGKTTLMKNVMYFLDNSIQGNSKSRISVSMIEYLKHLRELKKNSFTSLFMDEPDDSISHLSKLGKDIRKVYGKGRQHGIFSGICATDITDIPPYIWKKIHVLFFLPTWGSVWVFSNNPNKLKFPIQRIKKDIMQYGYDLLVNMQGYALKFPSYKHTPLDDELEEYEFDKWEDYTKDIDRVINPIEKEEKKIDKKEEIRESVRKWSEFQKKKKAIQDYYRNYGKNKL